ncbi:MAG: PA2779 family protein [Sulfurisoma sp.]|nr:PA2779 family protein [Sulfurisoma sp.]
MQGSFMKLISRLLIVCMLAVPFSSQAGMITTDQVATAAAQQVDARGVVNGYLARADVQSQLQTMGVSPDTAKDRVAAMTDEEVSRLAGQIQSQPAGAASGWAVAVTLGLIIWAVYYFYYR